MNTPLPLFMLGQATSSSSTTTVDATPGILTLVVAMLIQAVIGSLIYGLLLMLLSGPIGQKKVGFGPAFITCFIVAIISGIIGILLTLALGAMGGLAQLVVFFVTMMLMINKRHGIEMGRSAGIAAIMLVVAFVVAMVLGIMLAAVLLAVGLAGK